MVLEIDIIPSTYDAANRLVSVNAVNYTWDNNGNLLSDGEYTYTYDHANRLKTVTDGVNTRSYSYNGLGDRVSETVNEVTTDYVLDLAGGLTQVLAEGTNSYLNGNARIMQENSSEEKEYFLGDALGSVRMLTDEEGEITLLRSYEPYGEVLSSQGTGDTSYAFTGEQYDPQTGLVYLRARYYSTASGRFMSRDTWTGDEGMPMSYNVWLYGYGNPVRYSDPSGNYFCEDDCTHHNSLNYSANDIYITKLLEYGVATFGDWSTKELSTIYAGIRSIGSKFYSYSSFINGSPSSIFRAVFRNGVSVRKSTTAGGFCEASGVGFSCLSNVNFDTGLVIHEFGHTFNATFINENIEGLSPYNLLAKSSLFTSDLQFITGLHRVLSPDGNGYETKWDRTFSGYVDSVPPYAYHGTRWNDWNSASEEFADMFANWVKGSFSVDEAGNIRNGFMQAYMGTYIYQFANK